MRMLTRGVVGFALTTLFFLKFNQAPTLGRRFPKPGRWASMPSNGVNTKCRNVRFYGHLGQKQTGMSSVRDVCFCPAKLTFPVRFSVHAVQVIEPIVRELAM